eukprot:gene37547-42529_t
MSVDSTAIPSSSASPVPPAAPVPPVPSAAALPVQTVVPTPSGHIRLTSHSGGFGALPIRWGAATATERGPIVGTTTKRAHRNVIGTHSGSYRGYRALPVAAGAPKREPKAGLTHT